MVLIICRECKENLADDKSGVRKDCQAAAGGMLKRLFNKFFSGNKAPATQPDQPQSTKNYPPPVHQEHISDLPDDLSVLMGSDMDLHDPPEQADIDTPVASTRPTRNRAESTRPLVKTVFTVSSFTDYSTSYTVDTVKWTCTCPDWQKVRRNHSKGDIRRLCKHLVSVMGGHESFGPFAPIVARYAELKKGIHVADSGPDNTPPMLVLETGAGPLAIIAQRPKYELDYDDYGTQWVDVAFGGQHYSFSMDYDAWAYSESPPEPALGVFYSHLYKLTDIPGEIKTTQRSKSLRSIPKRMLRTAGVSENTISNGGHVAFGISDSGKVSCCINPKAAWQGFFIDKFFARYNVRSKEWEGHSRCYIFKNVAVVWIMAEYEECKKNLQQAVEEE